MKYMLLCYDDQQAWDAAGEAALHEAMQEAVELTHELNAQGKYIVAAPLEGVASAKCVRVRDGKPLITDGPFAETREHLGGFYLLDVNNLDEAIRIAGRHPGAPVGTVEIRPIVELAGLPKPAGATSIFQRALFKLLTEIFDGPPGQEAYLLNPGDVGLLRQLEGIDAAAASTRPMPGLTTVAAHVDHVHYGLTLLNRWAGGEANPFADADWNASWRRGNVTDEQWRLLRDNLRTEAQRWKDAVAARSEWDDIAAAGSLASAAHTAYHLGAIRQILAAMKLHKG